MERIDGKIEGPFVIDRDMQIYGMVTVAATVEPGCTLRLHGMVTGDLTVKPGGTAYVHGMVNGAVINEGGNVEVHGTVDRVVDTGTTTTFIHPDSRVRGTWG